MGNQPFVPLDEAAYEKFCGGLINAGFSPVEGSGRSRWNGPIRESLTSLTAAARMEIVFRDGWPLRYPNIRVVGLDSEHSAGGYVCLWADDDPAQRQARDIEVLWRRIDDWASAAEDGFRVEDQTLDGYMAFAKMNHWNAELPLGDLIVGTSNGAIVAASARTQGSSLLIGPGEAEDLSIKGVVYFRNAIGRAPRDLPALMQVLTRRQRSDLERGLASRREAGRHEPSGGYDFLVLAWPRHGKTHEALVLAFAGAGSTLEASAYLPTPSDSAARARRAGPDYEGLQTKRVLIAGAGSVGGHVAMSLACSGVGELSLCDDDTLKSANLVRHIAGEQLVGYSKNVATAVEIMAHAPSCKVTPRPSLPLRPDLLVEALDGQQLVIDCTGNFALTALLTDICHERAIPLVTSAIYHQGSVARIRRQAEGDTPIALRAGNPAYVQLPPASATAAADGFLEVGCTARVHNAPPTVVSAIANETALAVIDILAGRFDRPDEVLTVFSPMADPPFDKVGNVTPPAPT